MPQPGTKTKHVFLVINHNITLALPWREDQHPVSLTAPLSRPGSRPGDRTWVSPSPPSNHVTQSRAATGTARGSAGRMWTELLLGACSHHWGVGVGTCQRGKVPGGLHGRPGESGPLGPPPDHLHPLPLYQCPRAALARDVWLGDLKPHKCIMRGSKDSK